MIDTNENDLGDLETSGPNAEIDDVPSAMAEPMEDLGGFGGAIDDIASSDEAGGDDVDFASATIETPGDRSAANLQDAGGSRPDRRRKAVLGVPIEVVVTVGRARPLLSELVALKRDSVLSLDSKLVDPVEIVIGDRVIARGELQEIDQDTGRLGVRLTEVADLSQSL